MASCAGAAVAAAPRTAKAKMKDFIASSRADADRASSLHSNHNSGNTRPISQNSGAGRTARASTRLRIAAEMNRSEAGAARTARRTGAGPGGGLRLHRQETLTLHTLARELARPADRFRLFAGLLFGGLFVVTAELHLAENALALHLLLQRLEGLVDIVVANENLHALFL